MNFIIGSTGFLSLELISKLPDYFTRESLLSFRKGDIANQLDYIEKNLDESIPNTLIIAGWPTALDYDDFKHIEFYEQTVHPFVISLYSRFPHLRLITLGSCLEYGFFNGGMSESDLCVPCTKLGAAKLMMFRLCSEIYSTQYVHLRIFYPYSIESPRRNSFLSYLEDAVIQESASFDMSHGLQERDFFTTDYFCSCIQLLLADGNWPFRLANIGTGKPTSVKDLAQEYLDSKNTNLKLNLGKLPIPWYEPFSFYSSSTPTITDFFK